MNRVQLLRSRVMPGLSELILLLLIVVLIFGASKLPQLGESMGRALKNYRRARAQRDEIEVSAVDEGRQLEGDEGSRGGDPAGK